MTIPGLEAARPTGCATSSSRSPRPDGRGCDDLADGEWHRLHPATPLLKGGLVFIASSASSSPTCASGSSTRSCPACRRRTGDPVDYIIDHGYLGLARWPPSGCCRGAHLAFWLSWRMHTFRITDEAVEVRSGILFRTHRKAQLDRIQGINSCGRSSPAVRRREARGQPWPGRTRTCSCPTSGSGAADGVRRDILRLASGARAASAAARCDAAADARGQSTRDAAWTEFFGAGPRTAGVDPARVGRHRCTSAGCSARSCSTVSTIFLVLADRRHGVGRQLRPLLWLFLVLPGRDRIRQLLRASRSPIAALLHRRHARRRAGGLRPALHEQRDVAARAHPRGAGEPAAALAPGGLVGGQRQPRQSLDHQGRGGRIQRDHPPGRHARATCTGCSSCCCPTSPVPASRTIPVCVRRGGRPGRDGAGRRRGSSPPRAAPGCAVLVAAHRVRGASAAALLRRRGGSGAQLSSCRTARMQSVAAAAGPVQRMLRLRRGAHAHRRGPDLGDARRARCRGRRWILHATRRGRRSPLRGHVPSLARRRGAGVSAARARPARRRHHRRRPGRRRARGRARRAGHALIGIAAVSEASRDRADAMLPGVPMLPIPEVVERSELVLLAVPEGELAALVAGLADAGAWQPGQLVLHTAPAVRHRRARHRPSRAGAIPLACIRPCRSLARASTSPAARHLVRGHGAGPGAAHRQALVVEMGGGAVRRRRGRPRGLRRGHRHGVVVLAARSSTRRPDLLDGIGVARPGAVLAPLVRSAVENALAPRLRTDSGSDTHRSGRTRSAAGR